MIVILLAIRIFLTNQDDEFCKLVMVSPTMVASNFFTQKTKDLWTEMCWKCERENRQKAPILTVREEKYIYKSKVAKFGQRRKLAD